MPSSELHAASVHVSWRDAAMTRPLVWLALAALVGILWGQYGPAGYLSLSILGGLGVIAGGVAWRSSRLTASMAFTALCFAFLHLSLLSETRDHPLRLYLEQRDPADALTVVTSGRIEKALRRDLPGSIPREEYYVADEVTSPTLGRQWQGRTVLRLVTGRRENLPPGQYRITGLLRLPRSADNPGQFDERTYDLRLGLVAELRAMEIETLREDRWKPEAVLIQAAEKCRLWVETALKLDLEDSPREYAVILAMVMGTVQSGMQDIQTPFRLSGTLHIFSVSGLHVAIVGLILWKFLKAFGLSRGGLLAVLIPVLFAYAFVTGLRPSAVRAAVMASVFLCGAIFHRKADLLNSLGAAALLLLAYDPNQLFFPGFQLSFAVLAAIAVFTDPIASPLQKLVQPDPFLPMPLLTWWQRLFWSWRKEIASLLTVSAAAWIGSLPLTLTHFQTATPISLLANVVLVPLSFCVLFAALVTLLTASLHLTPLQILFSNANLLLATLTMQAAAFFAAIPGGNFRVPSDPLEKHPPAEFTVLRLPEGAAAQHLRIGTAEWLLDVGSEENLRSILRPYLQKRDVSQLSGVILSHGDIQHVGAASLLRTEYAPPFYYQAAREPWRWEGSNSSFKKLQRDEWRALPLQAGDHIPLEAGPGFPAAMEVLYPPTTNWPRRADDRALVLRLDLGQFRILWCGDSGFLAEKTILEQIPSAALRADVLVRNQHASDLSFLPEFVAAVSPQAVIASNQSFPAGQALPQSVREICGQQGIRLLDQSRTGAVQLKIWPDRLEIIPYRIPGEPTTLTPPKKG